jgi:hypothetical protein
MPVVTRSQSKILEEELSCSKNQVKQSKKVKQPKQSKPPKPVKIHNYKYHVSIEHDADKYNAIEDIYIDSGYFPINMLIKIKKNNDTLIEVNYFASIYRQDQGGGIIMINDSKTKIIIIRELSAIEQGEIGPIIEDEIENKFVKIMLENRCNLLIKVNHHLIYEIKRDLYKKLYNFEEDRDYSFRREICSEKEFEKITEQIQLMYDDEYFLRIINNNGTYKYKFDEEQERKIKLMYFKYLIETAPK